MMEETRLKPVSPAKLRRGLGVIFILVGVFYAATMTFAALVAVGRLKGVTLSAEAWAQLYKANYYFMMIGGAAYLGLSFIREGVFFMQSLVDFAFGVGIYVGMFFLSAVLLSKDLAPAWTAVVPGLILIVYGAALRRGRRFFLGLGASP